MTFAEPLAVPPMVLLAAPFRMATPSLAFGKPEGRGLWDVAGTLVTPMLFPWIRLLLVPGSLRRMPKRPLPDRTLPAPLAVPPMVLLDAPPKTAMPSAALGTVVLPLWVVPIAFPWMRLPVAAIPASRMPNRWLP